MHREEARHILPVAKISGNFTDRISANPLHAKFAEHAYTAPSMSHPLLAVSARWITPTLDPSGRVADTSSARNGRVAYGRLLRLPPY
jgi:hypothetical protein